MELADYLINEYKVYVEVNENRLADGSIVPLSFVWEDGKRYAIDRVIDVRPAASIKAGGAGLRYTVRIGKRETYMFLEAERGVDRWFMERR
jgi:hypothetical protein